MEEHRSCCCWHHQGVLEVDRNCRYCRKRTCWCHRSGLVADEQGAIVMLVMGFRKKKSPHSNTIKMINNTYLIGHNDDEGVSGVSKC